MLHCALGLPATRKTATEEDRGEDNKDPDRLIEQSVRDKLLEGGGGGGVTLRNAKKKDKIVAKSRIKFYFLQRLRQQNNCEPNCCLGILHLAIFGATCVATKLRDKLHEKLPSVTAPLLQVGSHPSETFTWPVYMHLFSTRFL